MPLVSFAWHYCFLVVESWFGIALVILGVWQLVEWLIDKKAPVPIWLRLLAFGALLFFAQASVYKRLSENPPTILHVQAPPPPIVQVTEPSKPAKAKPEQNQSGHDNVQSGSITQGPCSNLQLGGSNNSQGGNCEAPPLKLDWSVAAIPPTDGFSNSQMLSVKPNVDFHPVSFIIVCDQDIKAVNPGGVFFGYQSSGITKESNRVGYVYFDNPSLAAGVALQVVVSSDKQFKILNVVQHAIKLTP